MYKTPVIILDMSGKVILKNNYATIHIKKPRRGANIRGLLDFDNKRRLDRLTELCDDNVKEFYIIEFENKSFYHRALSGIYKHDDKLCIMLVFIDFLQNCAETLTERVESAILLNAVHIFNIIINLNLLDNKAAFDIKQESFFVNMSIIADSISNQSRLNKRIGLAKVLDITGSNLKNAALYKHCKLSYNIASSVSLSLYLTDYYTLAITQSCIAAAAVSISSNKNVKCTVVEFDGDLIFKAETTVEGYFVNCAFSSNLKHLTILSDCDRLDIILLEAIMKEFGCTLNYSVSDGILTFQLHQKLISPDNTLYEDNVGDESRKIEIAALTTLFFNNLFNE